MNIHGDYLLLGRKKYYVFKGKEIIEEGSGRICDFLELPIVLEEDVRLGDVLKYVKKDIENSQIAFCHRIGNFPLGPFIKACKDYKKKKANPSKHFVVSCSIEKDPLIPGDSNLRICWSLEGIEKASGEKDIQRWCFLSINPSLASLNIRLDTGLTITTYSDNKGLEFEERSDLNIVPTVNDFIGAILHEITWHGFPGSGEAKLAKALKND